MILSKVSYVMTLTIVRSVAKICKKTSPSMIDVLKKGLKTLKKHIASCKTQLKANLKAGNIISADDEEWLDGAGNLIDEGCVVELLDIEPDYERGLEKLDAKDRGIVQNLISLGGGDKEAPGKKRKHTSFH